MSREEIFKAIRDIELDRSRYSEDEIREIQNAFIAAILREEDRLVM